MSLAFEAMLFFRDAHKLQKRKYSGAQYFDHLLEVAGLASLIDWRVYGVSHDVAIATSLGHDSVEDVGVTHSVLVDRFGIEVADGIQWLSDMEEGNRATRKAASRLRLSNAPGWVQTIKCADLISNTSSIVQHDPNFAVVYLEEKRLLLDVLTKADPRLLALAKEQVSYRKPSGTSHE